MYRDFRDDWLTRLGRRLQLPELEFNEEGFCQLKLNQTFIVTFRKAQDNDSLVLFSQIPMEPISPEVMQMMLLENRNSAKSATPVMSVTEKLNAIGMHYKLSPKELYETGDVIALLLERLEYWRKVAVA